MEAGYGPKRVQLEGEDMERARKGGEEVASSLNAMASFVLDTVHGTSRAAEDLKVVFVRFNNTTTVVYDGTNCGAYEDPPGICRDCSDDELAIMQSQ